MGSLQGFAVVHLSRSLWHGITGTLARCSSTRVGSWESWNEVGAGGC